MFVKICGMTRQQDLDLASSLGANLCGFIFAQQSPRFITPGAAAALDSHGMARVGVFLTDDNGFILRTAAEARLDFIQLHGRQSSATALAAGPSRVIRVLWPGTYPDAESCQKDLDKASGESAFLLFDAGKQGSGGTGTRFQWSLLDGVRIPLPWLLSGGLTPESPADIALLEDRPDGLDFNSGLEDAPGIKNAGLMREAFANLRKAGLAPDSRFDLKGQRN